MVDDIDVDEHHQDKFVRFIDWLNHKLAGKIGPADIGPYNHVVKRMALAVCPICGRPMAEHTIDRSTANTVLNCPAPHLPPVVDDEPVNELGMPKRMR